MSVIDVAVILTGVGLIAFELWFFLGPRKQVVAARPESGGVQEVQILVKGGYVPDTIPVEVGRPVRLSFYRDETAECSEQVIFGTLGIERELPAFETTVIEFTPNGPGDYPFHCGKSVMQGRVVAQLGGAGARANLGRGHDKHA